MPNYDGRPESAQCVQVAGETQNSCANTRVLIEPLYTGTGLVTKIPVVLAELNIKIPVDTVITLPEPALEIKQIKKRLKITQCLLVRDSRFLFIKGFVRKNIDYATRGRCSNAKGVCGDIRFCAVDVPFECTTPVTFNNQIVPDPLEPIVPNTRSEFEYFKREPLKGPEFAEKDELMSGDFSEFNQISTENFAELPFCELVASRIVEFDEFLDRRVPDRVRMPFEEREFKRIEEKMMVLVVVKILQTRQIYVPPTITIIPPAPIPLDEQA